MASAWPIHSFFDAIECIYVCNFHAFRLIPIMMLRFGGNFTDGVLTVHSQFISGDSCSWAAHTYTHTLCAEWGSYAWSSNNMRLQARLLLDSKNSDEIIMRNFSMERRRAETVPDLSKSIETTDAYWAFELIMGNAAVGLWTGINAFQQSSS